MDKVGISGYSMSGEAIKPTGGRSDSSPLILIYGNGLSVCRETVALTWLLGLMFHFSISI